MTKPRARAFRVVVAGNPNTGKTTLFNALTHARARTGNYAGVTVERRVGRFTHRGVEVELVDVPGTYSLSARSAEETIAIDEILPRRGPGPDLVLFVADASALARNLYLAVQVLEAGVPTLLCLNMIDEARASGLDLDVRAIEARLDARACLVSARTGEGLDRLRDAVVEELQRAHVPRLELSLDSETRSALAEVEKAVRQGWSLRADAPSARVAALARWAFLSVGDDELVDVPQEVRAAVERARAALAHTPGDGEERLVSARYALVDDVVAAAVRQTAHRASATDRIDAVLTHPVGGLAIFIVVMATLFQFLFAWSEPLVSAIEAAVAAGQDVVRATLPEGPLAELLVDGVLAGAGNVVVFVPQIAILSLFLVLLEDSGYLARVAFVIDRVMHGVGLHGRAFVPLLSGFACAVPAVMATRTIENRRDRLVTMLALPLMSCSARLPVYTLVVAVAFPTGAATVLGLEAGAVALLAMYALSVTATLGAAAVLKRTVLRGPRPALLLELPPYRWPDPRTVLRATVERTSSFLWNAGTVIAAITIVLWALLSFPRDEAVEAALDERMAQASALIEESEREEALRAVANERAEARLAHSVAGRFGRAIEPLLEPLGFDWKIGVGIIASFAAREVLVSTLGIVYGVGEHADETSEGLRSRLRSARRADGRALFSPLTGLSLMVFFVLAAQCMSTLAAVRRESGSWRWPLFMLLYMNALAYLASFLVYQGGRLLGFE